MIYNPLIIMKCLSTQATYINKRYGQMFYFTDKGQVYVDTQNQGRILATDIYILQYERERTNFVPDNRSTMATEPDVLTNDQLYVDFIYIYVVETNSLYKYNYSSRIWQTLYGTYGSTVVAQTYTPEGDGVIISADDVTTNGILNDGSVVIRDANKMICGLAKSDGYSLTINSLIGGQINIEPSGSPSGNGCLQLNSKSYETNLNNDLIVYGQIKTAPKTDWNKQYRLVTEDINIISTTSIKAGSLIKSGSSLGSTKYTEDTRLDKDITVTSGLITVNSRLYINTIINGEQIKPPYLFDIDNMFISNTNVSTVILTNTTKSGTTLIVDSISPFNNVGDSCFVKNTENMTSITKVKFKQDNKEYSVEYVAKDGINISMHIVYSFDGNVKIIP